MLGFVSVILIPERSVSGGKFSVMLSGPKDMD